MAAFTTATNDRASTLGASPRVVAVVVMASVGVAALGVLAAGSGMVTIVLVAGAVVAVVGVSLLRKPALALPIAIWSMWFEGVGGDTLSVGRVMAAGLIGLVVLRVLVGGERLRVPPTICWAPPLAFLTWAWASGMWSVERGPWLFTTLSLFIGLGYYLVVFLEARSPEQLWRIFKVWVWVGAFVAALSVSLATLSGSSERVPGLSGGANNYATYLVCTVPFLALYLAEAKGPWKLVLAGVFALYGLALVKSGSRAGLVAAVAVSLYVILTFPSSSKGAARVRRIVVGLGVLAAAGLAAVALNPERFLLLSSAAADRGAGRLDIWNAGLHTLKAHWLFGMGMGQFREQSTTILQQVTGSSLRIGEYVSREGADTLDTHNQYLQLWLDLGIIGLGLYFTMIGTTVYTLWFRAAEEWRRLVWAFIGVLLAVHLALMFMTQINQKFLWVVMGASAAMASAAGSSRTGADPGRVDEARTVQHL